ncbi:hypothetical protein BC834DRAFT_231989 [Gloeopeniophorella convolvens]|nr:hypothetical protein BC834DRAFT_231989 [Gloeopeniophorella convolvens]
MCTSLYTCATCQNRHSTLIQAQDLSTPFSLHHLPSLLPNAQLCCCCVPFTSNHIPSCHVISTAIVSLRLCVPVQIEHLKLHQDHLARAGCRARYCARRVTVVPARTTTARRVCRHRCRAERSGVHNIQPDTAVRDGDGPATLDSVPLGVRGAARLAASRSRSRSRSQLVVSKWLGVTTRSES